MTPSNTNKRELAAPIGNYMFDNYHKISLALFPGSMELSESINNEIQVKALNRISKSQEQNFSVRPSKKHQRDQYV
jgi:hypothetical protein